MQLHQWGDIDYRGTITRIDYETVDMQGKPWAKYANVYLPYQYDEKKKYNILYLMHGGGGNPDAWLDASQIKNVLDLGFGRGLAEPFIVVFPTYYDLRPSEHRRDAVDASWEYNQVKHFQTELEKELIPAIESRFSTYAEDTTHEGLKASRTHRAFGGFSMGGATTWCAFEHHLDIIAEFLPLSGDCWAIEPKGGCTKPEETAAFLVELVKRSGYTKDDFRLFIGTGRQDIAYNNLIPQIREMKKYPETFVFSDDPKEGNMHFALKEDAPHAYEQVYHHVWNYLPYLFA